jgi:hypothetical protein
MRPQAQRLLLMQQSGFSEPAAAAALCARKFCRRRAYSTNTEALGPTIVHATVAATELSMD